MTEAATPADRDAELEDYLARHRESGERSALAVFARLDSTNRLAASIARSYLVAGLPAPRLIVVAREQLAGRGRRGRSWHSPAGLGIYTSLLLAPGDAAALAALPLRVPVALAEALAPTLGAPCGIKWPNDLVVGGRKLGGILIEAPAATRAAVVGYGVNVGQRLSALPAGATSIREITGGAPELPALTTSLAGQLMRRLTRPEPVEEVLASYRGLSVHRPGETLRCRVEGEQLEGRFAGFDDTGRLVLECPEGERTLSVAELIEGPGASGRTEGR